MKPLIPSLLLGLGLCARAATEPDDAVQRLALDPLAVTRIPVAMDRLTTIRFPSPVSDLEAALMSTDPDPPALFQLSLRPGQAFFSVRALVRHTNATLNVVWKNQTYVLELVETNRPWLSVVFETRAAAAVTGASRPVTPTRLLGLIDTAKAYPLLKSQHPAAVVGIECVRPNSVHDYGDYTIRIEEVLRFDAADTLVFRIILSNQTSQVLRYLPQSFMVRAGERVYSQSITDGSGELPPRAGIPVYLAITGTSDGGRNDLSPRNEFMILLSRLGLPATSVSVSTPPPAAAPAVAPLRGWGPPLSKPAPVPTTATVAAPAPFVFSAPASPMRLIPAPGAPVTTTWLTPLPRPVVVPASSFRPYYYPPTPHYYVPAHRGSRSVRSGSGVSLRVSIAFP